MSFGPIGWTDLWSKAQKSLLEVATRRTGNLGYVAGATDDGLLRQLVYNWTSQRQRELLGVHLEPSVATPNKTVDLLVNIPSLVQEAPNKLKDSSLEEMEELELSLCYLILGELPAVWAMPPQKKKKHHALVRTRRRTRSQVDTEESKVGSKAASYKKKTKRSHRGLV